VSRRSIPRVGTAITSGANGSSGGSDSSSPSASTRRSARSARWRCSTSASLRKTRDFENDAPAAMVGTAEAGGRSRDANHSPQLATTPMTDYGHELQFGIFITPAADQAQAIAAERHDALAPLLRGA